MEKNRLSVIVDTGPLYGTLGTGKGVNLAIVPHLFCGSACIVVSVVSDLGERVLILYFSWMILIQGISCVSYMTRLIIFNLFYTYLECI